jgi:hypothetical protein
MKNIHLIPTDKPTGIFQSNSGLQFSIRDKVRVEPLKGFHIYITSDEEIKEGDWTYNIILKTIFTAKQELIDLINHTNVTLTFFYKKIILTTDLQLIADGVQAITDDFLEWFVKNPSCESVEVKEKQHFEFDKSKRINPLNGVYYSYKIIIPKEEPKQETLEEAVNAFKKTNVYTNKIKQEQERSYSEEEVEIIIQKLMNDVHCGDLCYGDNVIDFKMSPRQWFEQFKKK